MPHISAIESRHAEYTLLDHALVYDINGPLFFGFAQKALKTISTVQPDVRIVVLDMSEVTMLDMSAIVAMESIANDLSAINIGLIINNLQPRMILKLRRAGIRKRIGKVAFSRSLEDGFGAARKML